MMKSEFESLAMRKHGAEIPYNLYKEIETFYMDDSKYHEANGGIYETKQEFVKRVFGGAVNTVDSIKEKLGKEYVRRVLFEG